MKILIKFCLLCSLSFIGVNTLQGQHMQVTKVSETSTKACYSMTVTTSSNMYFIKVGGTQGQSCYSANSCQKTMCFTKQNEARTTILPCITQSTAHTAAQWDGCTVVISPKGGG